MKKVLIVLLLLTTSLAFGQGILVSGSVSSSAWVYGQKAVIAIPGAKMTVCANPAMGVPCTNTVALYSDVGLTHRISNPVTLDADSGYSFYVANMVLQYTVTQVTGLKSGPYPLTSDTTNMARVDTANVFAQPQTLPADPTLPLQAVTKQYVDALPSLMDANAPAKFGGFTDTGAMSNVSLGFTLVSAGQEISSVQIKTDYPWVGCTSAATVSLVDSTGTTVTTVDSSSPFYVPGSNVYGWMQSVTKPVNVTLLNAGTLGVTFTSPHGCSQKATNVWVYVTSTPSVSTVLSGTITVTVTPTTVSLVEGDTQQFSAVVTGSSDTTAIWSVDGVVGGNSTVGTIDSTGLYIAPESTGSHIITAASDANSSATAGATVAVSAPTSGILVTVTPTTASLGAAWPQQFSASVSGSTAGVTWSVDGINGGNSTVGTVDSTGLYTAPSAAGTHTVTATSNTDSVTSGSATVTDSGSSCVHVAGSNPPRSICM